MDTFGGADSDFEEEGLKGGWEEKKMLETCPVETSISAH
jgi:hypothetical protein